VTNGKMAVHNTALAADTPAKIASAAVVRSLLANRPHHGGNRG